MPVWIGVISSIEEIKYIEDIKNLDVKLSTVAITRIYSQGFEKGETDLTANNCTQTVQSTEVFGGSYALKVTVPAGQTGYVETPKRPVSPNQLLTFSFTHKEDANITELKLIVVWYRANGGIITTDEFTLTPSTSWSIESRTVSAPQNATAVSLRIQATAGGENGTIYIDEITIDIVGQILSVDHAGRVKINIDEDSVGLAKDQTLQAVRDRLPSALTANGNFKVAIQEDNANLLKEGGNVNVANFPSDYPLPSGTNKIGSVDVASLPTLNLQEIGGTPLTGRNWSDDFAKLQNLDVQLSTRASEATLSDIKNKLRDPVDNVFVKDVSVGTSAIQADSDTQVREEITILADEENTDTVYVGNSSAQLFPLKPGASLTLRKCSLSKIYLKAKSGTQTIHIIAGGV